MDSAQYIAWCFKMAKVEEHHPNFRNGYLKCALKFDIRKHDNKAN